MVLLLMVLTLGIYYIYWLVKFDSEVKGALGEKSSGCVQILLILFVPFYVLYWEYQTAKRLAKLGGTDNAMMVILMSIFLTPIAAPIILQAEANKLVR